MESKMKIIEKLRNSDNLTSYLSQSVFENNLRESLDNPKTSYIFNLDENRGFNRNKNIDFLKSNIFHTKNENHKFDEIKEVSKSLAANKYKKNLTTIEIENESKKEQKVKPCIRLKTTIDKLIPKEEKKKNMMERFYEPEYKSNMSEFKKKHLDFLYKGNSLGYNNHKIDLYSIKSGKVSNSLDNEYKIKNIITGANNFNTIDNNAFDKNKKTKENSKKLNNKIIKNSYSKQMDEIVCKNKKDKLFNKPNDTKVNNRKGIIISDTIKENIKQKTFYKPKQRFSMGFNQNNDKSGFYL